MKLNLYSIPLLICTTLTIFFGFLVFNKNRYSKKNSTFFLLCLSIAIWLFLYTICYNLSDGYRYLNVPILKIAYCFITFIPILCFHHTIEILNIKPSRLFISLFYLIGLVSTLLILSSNLIIQNYCYNFFWGNYPAAGPYHPIYLIFFFAPIITLYKVIIDSLITTFEWEKRNQVNYLLAAMFILNFSVLDFIPNYGVEFYPIGFLPTTIFIGIYAYATIKYKLIDITIVLRKGFVYSLAISLISILYLLLIVSFGESLRIQLNYDSPFFNICTAFILGIIFVPMKHRIEQYIERSFFKGTQEEIVSENKKLRQAVTQTEKYKTLATLASGIAHEIRNPLTVIKTFTEYLPTRHQDSEFVKKYSRLTSKEVERINELVNRLMEYSKPNPPKFTQVPLKKLLNNSTDALNNSFLSHHVHCVKNINISDDLTLQLDPNQIHQAIMNIMLNSIEAMPDGGQLFIGASILSRQIKSHVKHNKVLQIIIKDTGHGISEEHINRIFDPFFTNKDFGTGLGLAIVQGIVEGHHGRISVKSKVNQGTEITIELPTV